MITLLQPNLSFNMLILKLIFGLQQMHGFRRRRKIIEIVTQGLTEKILGLKISLFENAF